MEIPTIFLVGTSILDRVADPLIEMTKKLDVKVVKCCRGGNFLENWRKIKLPVSNSSKDVLILHFLGNNMFEHKGVVKDEKGAFHLNLPSFLSDSKINSLINQTVQIVKAIRTNFMGIIKLVGPFPRILKPCCPDPRHALPYSPPFHNPISYILAFN